MVRARVQAKHGKEWYEASVLRAEESRLRVHWRGWGAAHDAWVQRDPAWVRRSQRREEPTRVVEDGTEARERAGKGQASAVPKRTAEAAGADRPAKRARGAAPAAAAASSSSSELSQPPSAQAQPAADTGAAAAAAPHGSSEAAGAAADAAGSGPKVTPIADR